MYPDKHFRDLESSRKRRKLASHFAATVSFLASFFFLGQLVHETMHVLPLELLGCRYHIDAGFGLLTGLYAEVQPLCTPPDSFLVLFYPLGYLSTIVAGWGLLLLSRSREEPLSQAVAASGTRPPGSTSTPTATAGS
ncbi:MAG: hypothetical protein ABEJ66_02460, partial [Candidatus Nanohaloarchaea archaeon]